MTRAYINHTAVAVPDNDLVEVHRDIIGCQTDSQRGVGGNGYVDD